MQPRAVPHLHVSCTAERRLAQPDNDYAVVLTVPDKNLCKQAFLTAARVLAAARLLHVSCVCTRYCWTRSQSDHCPVRPRNVCRCMCACVSMSATVWVCAHVGLPRPRKARNVSLFRRWDVKS